MVSRPLWYEGIGLQLAFMKHELCTQCSACSIESLLTPPPKKTHKVGTTAVCLLEDTDGAEETDGPDIKLMSGKMMIT